MSNENLQEKNCVLVYGSNGFLGAELIEELKRQNKSYKIGLARVENRQELINEIKLVKPSRILCMAGLTGKPNISWFETNQIEGIRINILGQLNVADVANDFNLHCTLLSTGVIYKYDENHPLNSGIGYKEEDEPNYSGNFYCYFRILEEKLLKSYTNVLNLRISYPTTGNLKPNSFLSKIVSFKKIQSVPLSITVVDDLWPILVDMSDKKITGTFNFNNEGTISHNEVLEIYKNIVDANHTWESSPADLTNRGACELDVSKLISLGYKVPNVKESFRRLITKYKEEKEKLSELNELKSSNEHEKTCKEKEKKKILITNGASYLGLHCLIELGKNDEYDLVVVDTFSNSNESDLKKVEKILNKKVEYFQLDICDKHCLSTLFKKQKFHLVLHLPSNSSDSFLNEKRTLLDSYEDCLTGTISLLKCMNENNVRNLVFSSSSLDKQKQVIEEMLFNLNKSNQDWNVFVLRVPNLVGSHKSLELNNTGLNCELINQLCQAVRGDDSSIQLSLPLKSESLIHVIDAANAIRLCIENLASSLSLNEFKIYSIENSLSANTKDLVENFEQLSKKKINYKYSENSLEKETLIKQSDKSFSGETSEFVWQLSKNLEDICKEALGL